jgi:hypothetical protein
MVTNSAASSVLSGNQLPWRRGLLSFTCHRTSDRKEASSQVLQTYVHLWSGNIPQQSMRGAWFSLTSSLISWWLNCFDFTESLHENYMWDIKMLSPLLSHLWEVRFEFEPRNWWLWLKMFVLPHSHEAHAVMLPLNISICVFLRSHHLSDSWKMKNVIFWEIKTQFIQSPVQPSCVGC